MDIQITWSTEDILGECPWLTTVAANELLEYLDNNHDANVGINWGVIRDTADILTPTPELQKTIALSIHDTVLECYGGDNAWDIGMLAQDLYTKLKQDNLIKEGDTNDSNE